MITERYKFYNAQQETNEDVPTFNARLKNLARNCAFETFLEEALRDKLVCELKSDNSKRKLLSEDNLTLEKAYKIAMSMELAEGEVSILGSVGVNKLSVRNDAFRVGGSKANLKGESSVSKASKFSKVSSQARCKRCLRVHFEGQSCPAIKWKCYACQELSHTAKSTLCRNKVHKMGQGESDSKEDGEEEILKLGIVEENVFVNTVNGKESSSLKARVVINSRPVLMEVDTDACKSVIHKSDYEYLFSKVALEPVGFKLKVVTGDNVKIVGQISVKVVHRKRIVSLPLIVLESKSRFNPLLGRNWLNVLEPSWMGFLNTISCEKENVEKKCLCKIINDERDNVYVKRKFSRLFSDQMGSTVKNFEVELKLKENTEPIFHRAYSMPYALKEKVEVELGKLVKDGMLTKVDVSKWASPIVVVPRKNTGEFRPCVDFKKTLNRVLDGDHCVLLLPEDIFAILSGGKCFTVIDLKGAY